MWWIIIIGVVVILGILLNNYNKKEEKKDKENGIIYKIEYVNYFGGFQDIQVSYEPHATIKIDKNNINCNFLSHYSKRVIPLNKIIDVKCSNIEEIKSQVSLGKLIVFGFLAFGMKGKKKNKPCVIVSYNDENNIRRDVVFGTDYSQIVVRKIMEIKNQYCNV